MTEVVAMFAVAIMVAHLLPMGAFFPLIRPRDPAAQRHREGNPRKHQEKSQKSFHPEPPESEFTI
ncbi:MAG TPA: hypothetical protein VF799_00375 [Geobacteraceae bacterium]